MPAWLLKGLLGGRVGALVSVKLIYLDTTKAD